MGVSTNAKWTDLNSNRAGEETLKPKPGNNIRIPLPEEEALNLLLKVKPTADMPRQRNPAAKPKKRKRSK
jgi:hypothetical protein